MTQKLMKILAVLGIGSVTLFQAGGCDYLADQFAKGFEIGYNGGSFDDLFTTDCGYSDSSYDDISRNVDDVWNYDSETGSDYWW